MLTTLTPPAGSLFSPGDATLRQHVRLEDAETDEDVLLDAIVATAVAQVEAYTRRRLLTQTLRLTLDGFGCGGLEATPLPVAPIQSVDQVQYLDDAGTWQTVPPTDYRLVDSVEPLELWPAFGRTWPVPKREPAVVRIDLVVGYGASASAVPADILAAVRMLVAHLDLHREAVSREASSEVPFGVREMLAAHRLWV